MKFKITLAIALASLANAHHCNEYTSNISQCRHGQGWFGKRRLDKVVNNQHKTEHEDDLIHRHDMHSFTGVEGINHKSQKNDAEDGISRPRIHKKLLQMSDNLLRRHNMHSYTSLEGMDHFTATSSNEQTERGTTPIVHKSRRRYDHFKTYHVVKPMKQVQQKHEEDLPAEWN